MAFMGTDQGFMMSVCIECTDLAPVAHARGKQWMPCLYINIE